MRLIFIFIIFLFLYNRVFVRLKNCIHCLSSSDIFLLSASSSPRVHSVCNKWVPKNFLWGTVRPERGADNFAVPFVPNVKVRIEAQRSTSLPLSESAVTWKLYLYLVPSVQGGTRYYKVINQIWRIVKLDVWRSLRWEYQRHAAEEMWTNRESVSEVEPTFWINLTLPSWGRIERSEKMSRSVFPKLFWPRTLFGFEK